MERSQIIVTDPFTIIKILPMCNRNIFSSDTFNSQDGVLILELDSGLGDPGSNSNSAIKYSGSPRANPYLILVYLTGLL